MEADAITRWDKAIDASTAPDCCKSQLGEPLEQGNIAVRICKMCKRKHRYMLADISKLVQTNT